MDKEFLHDVLRAEIKDRKIPLSLGKTCPVKCKFCYEKDHSYRKTFDTPRTTQEDWEFILNEIQNEDYDIVALQEVFHFDSGIDPMPQSVINLRNGASPNYHLLDGPVPAGVEMNSGLLTLVKRGLASNPVFQHAPQSYESATGDALDDLFVQGFDALAQKGFTLDTVKFKS